MRTRNVKRAFTLIEILIVVVILGILAAIVIPQFTDAAEDANTSSLHSQLQTVRSQVELYNVQFPANAYDDVNHLDTWDELLQNDFLQAAPRNPFATGAGQDPAAIDAAAAATNGWCWQPNAAGDAWSWTLRPLDDTGAIMYTDALGIPY